jgi:hypothetical protein
MGLDLAQLFPAVYEPHVTGRDANVSTPPSPEPKPDRPLNTRARMVLALELRGLHKTEIAVRLRLSEAQVQRLTRTDGYIAARDAALDRMDAEFRAMKPMAFEALRRGLKSGDENTALRASEQWMRAVGFMRHGNGEGRQGVTAEDVAKVLTVNVNIKAEE